MRENNYPRFVAEMKIKDLETAVRQMALMNDVLKTLKTLSKKVPFEYLNWVRASAGMV